MRLPDTVPVTPLADPLFTRADVRVDVLRLDLLDPVLSGNKPFKLIHNLAQAKAQGHTRILSFGGAWSNHIHALAEAGYRAGIEVVAVIRGQEEEVSTATLDFALSRSVKLLKVTRADYRRRRDNDFLESLRRQVGDFYLIPEGGANAEGVAGCTHITSLIQQSLAQMPDEILLACGTGTTLAGVVTGLHERHCQTFVRGIAVLKGAGFLATEIQRWLPACISTWAVETDYHWGGYARFPAALQRFVQDFERMHPLLLDPVYTAKLFAAVYQRVQDGYYRPGTHLLLVHSGGLQGRAGYSL